MTIEEEFELVADAFREHGPRAQLLAVTTLAIAGVSDADRLRAPLHDRRVERTIAEVADALERISMMDEDRAADRVAEFVDNGSAILAEMAALLRRAQSASRASR